MVVGKLRQNSMANRGYEANIEAVMEEIKTEQHNFGAYLAKISEDLRKKGKQKEYDR